MCVYVRVNNRKSGVRGKTERGREREGKDVKKFREGSVRWLRSLLFKRTVKWSVHQFLWQTSNIRPLLSLRGRSRSREEEVEVEDEEHWREKVSKKRWGRREFEREMRNRRWRYFSSILLLFFFHPLISFPFLSHSHIGRVRGWIERVESSSFPFGLLVTLHSAAATLAPLSLSLSASHAPPLESCPWLL